MTSQLFYMINTHCQHSCQLTVCQCQLSCQLTVCQCQHSCQLIDCQCQHSCQLIDCQCQHSCQLIVCQCQHSCQFISNLVSSWMSSLNCYCYIYCHFLFVPLKNILYQIFSIEQFLSLKSLSSIIIIVSQKKICHHFFSIYISLSRRTY